MLSGRVALHQVPESGDRLGNWSDDEDGVIVIRWKNVVWMLHIRCDQTIDVDIL